MKRRHGPFAVAAAFVAVAVVGVAGITSAIERESGSDEHRPIDSSASRSFDPTRQVSSDALARSIAKSQATLRLNPNDYQAWAVLGLDYVQQAKVTVNPAYYPKATGALAKSLKLHHAGNYIAMAGEAALNAAEHRFRAARRWALRGLRINPDSAVLYGALNDADTQLGRYDEAFAAVRHMNRLQPGVPSFTRAEYVYELRGNLSAANRILQTALRRATDPADVAFIRYYLGQLAFNNGRFHTALKQNEAGLAADPSYFALLEGKAKAEAALGRNKQAKRDYLQVVSEVPQPEYVVEAGDFLMSIGDVQQARAEYSLFRTENKLFTSNGVTLDTDPTLFYADHGRPKLAMKYARAGLRIRPFIEMYDAYAWALHANHRDKAALAYEHRAMALGTRSALFAFHCGMIERSLGDNAAAKRDLSRALSINPRFNPLQAPIARRALRSIEAGR